MKNHSKSNLKLLCILLMIIVICSINGICSLKLISEELSESTTLENLRGNVKETSQNLKETPFIDEKITRTVPESNKPIFQSHNNKARLLKEKSDVLLKDGSIITTIESIYEEIGISGSEKDINKLIKVINSKVQVTIGFQSSQRFSYSSYGYHLLNTNAEVKRKLPMLNAIVVEVPIPSLKAFLSYWQALETVRYVELAQVTSVSAVTNDPDWSLQYGPQIIQADLAWDIQIGDLVSVLIAVIDTGIDYTHPDLVNQYVTGGYDYVNDDTDPMDDHSHGTHCAGTIGATINNSVGIAGVANVSIMAQKVFDSGGYGYDYDAASAMISATDAGADILSNSYGFPSTSTALEDAVAYSAANDVVIVVSAGNSGASVSTYPALYPETITVSATDNTDTPASFTSYGPAVDVAAPGVSIWSTIPVSKGSYGSMSGTSMACPHVAGVCALIRAEFPAFSANQVRQHLRTSAEDLGAVGWDDYYGYGRINAFHAVQPPPEHELMTYLQGTPAATLPNEMIDLKAIVYNYGQNTEINVKLQLWIEDELVANDIFTPLAVGENGTLDYSWTPTVTGVYNITAYTVPVEDEVFLENNRVTKMVDVTSPIIEYNIGDYIQLNEADDSLFANFTYLYDIDPTHVYVEFGNGYYWFSVNTITRLLENGNYWVGMYYPGQIETDISVGETINWYSTTGTVEGTAYYDWNGMILEAWNVSIAWGNTYAYYHKETGIWLYYQEWTGLELFMINTSMIIWQPPEHDLQVFLETPILLPPSNSTKLNGSVYNGGTSDETNVELQLWINDNKVDSFDYSSLLSGATESFSYDWTPTVSDMYNITVFAVPVTGETILNNNKRTQMVMVKEPGQYLILQDANPWGYDWTFILDSYEITYDIIGSFYIDTVNFSFYERIVLTSDQPQSYYDAIDVRLSKLEIYAMNGGIVEIHAADNGWNGGSWVSSLPGGINYIYSSQNIIDIVDPTHPILKSPHVITDEELDGWSSSAHGYLANIGDSNIILNGSGEPVLIQTTYGSGHFLISTQCLEWGYSRGDSEFLENVLLHIPMDYSHDLGVYLEAPSLMETSTTTVLNASVTNRGASEESSVELQLWINDNLEYSEKYEPLTVGATKTLSYIWTPTEDNIYNITAYAIPVTGEICLVNNVDTKMITVTTFTLISDFEGILNGWKWDGLWHTVNDSQPYGEAHSPVHSVYYGQDDTGDYDTGSANSGTLMTSWYTLGSMVSSVTFWSWYETEESGHSWDRKDVYLVTLDETWIQLGYVSGEMNTWVQFSFDISAYADQTVRFAFVFDTIDFIDNSYRGWYIDDVTILGTATQILFHDLVTSLNTPNYILFETSVTITVSVTNLGDFDENNVILQLWINDTLDDSTSIDSLLIGDIESLTYSWTPPEVGYYNITAYSIPIVGELFTDDNQITIFTFVNNPIIEFDVGDYIYFNQNDSSGSSSPSFHFIYLYFIDPIHIYAEMTYEYFSFWCSVNILTRMIEDSNSPDMIGDYWLAQIETDLKIGDSVYWASYVGTVIGDAKYEFNGVSIEAWNISFPAQDSYLLFHKTTGLWLYYSDIDDFIIYIVETDMFYTGVIVKEDTNPPTVINPSDVTYQEGTSGNVVSWISYDSNPSKYIIYKDNTILKEDYWGNGVSIEINIDGLTIGTYNYTILVFDISGNSMRATVLVTVTEGSTNTNTMTTTTKRRAIGFEVLFSLITLVVSGSFFLKNRKRT